MSYSDNHTERVKTGHGVKSAWGWEPNFVSLQAPHCIIKFKDSAKILKEVLSTAAGIISFIRIRALNRHLNHKMLSRNGSTLWRNSLILQRLRHMMKLRPFFLLLRGKESPLLKQFSKLAHLWKWMSHKSLYKLLYIISVKQIHFQCIKNSLHAQFRVYVFLCILAGGSSKLSFRSSNGFLTP